jgi:hypothetical protein
MDNLITALTLIVLAIIVGLIALFIGLIGWVVLMFMKEMLHLDIKIGARKDDSKKPFS